MRKILFIVLFLSLVLLVIIQLLKKIYLNKYNESDNNSCFKYKDLYEELSMLNIKMIFFILLTISFIIYVELFCK